MRWRLDKSKIECVWQGDENPVVQVDFILCATHGGWWMAFSRRHASFISKTDYTREEPRFSVLLYISFSCFTGVQMLATLKGSHNLCLTPIEYVLRRSCTSCVLHFIRIRSFSCITGGIVKSNTLEPSGWHRSSIMFFSFLWRNFLYDYDFYFPFSFVLYILWRTSTFPLLKVELVRARRNAKLMQTKWGKFFSRANIAGAPLFYKWN